MLAIEWKPYHNILNYLFLHHIQTILTFNCIRMHIMVVCVYMSAFIYTVEIYVFVNEK